MKRVTESRAGHGADPSFFRAICLRARRGDESWDVAGRELLRHVDRLVDLQDLDGWPVAGDRLCEIARGGSDAELLAWLRTYLPRCVARVPAEAHARFLTGCWRALDDEPSGL